MELPRGGDDPYSKYHVEMAKNGKGLVHIRCCYNNKYWVRWSENHWWIVAGADETDEDQSLWTCTLFEPVYVDGDAQTLRFRHGDNDCYLSARTIEGRPYLEFASTDIGDPTVGNEVFTTQDGSARIKSDYFGKFWRRSPNWILADSMIPPPTTPIPCFGPIYDQRVIVMTTGGAINMTQEPHTQQVKLSGVPFIADGKLEVSSEFSGTGTYEWGETESLTTAKETVYSVTVPARTRVTISMIATQGSCDVPFSYTQRDTLTDGQNVVYNMDDGVYVGVNCFNVEYQTKEEKL
ncbi:hypothetical protein AAG906_018726 [Vitis piasezkii]